ncbi:hypothetical protein NMY22_g15105 [Coprinellus aureogranulatus]|nr:hypothetical protein NMY22_g15105 [Coprinellus aureogranulatus]
MRSINLPSGSQTNLPQPRTPEIDTHEEGFSSHLPVSEKDGYPALSNYNAQGKLEEMKGLVKMLNDVPRVETHLEGFRAPDDSMAKRLADLEGDINRLFEQAETLLHDIEMGQRIIDQLSERTHREFRELNSGLLLSEYPEIRCNEGVDLRSAVVNRNNEAYREMMANGRAKLKQQEQDYKEFERQRGTRREQPEDETVRKIQTSHDEPGWHSKLGGLVKRTENFLESMRSWRERRGALPLA